MGKITSWRIQRLLIGLTQAELAKRSRVRQARISEIERGLAQPTPDEADRLIGVLAQTKTSDAPTGRAFPEPGREPFNVPDEELAKGARR